MRILFSAVLAASFAAVSLPALAETAQPVKEKACKTLTKTRLLAPEHDRLHLVNPGERKGQMQDGSKAQDDVVLSKWPPKRRPYCSMRPRKSPR